MATLKKHTPTTTTTVVNDLEAQVTAAAATLATVEEELSRRRNQIADADAAAEAAEREARQLEEGEAVELLPALDGDAAATQRLDACEEQIVRAERTARRTKATARALRQRIVVCEYQVTRARRELVLLQRRAGAERTAARWQRITERLTGDLLPALREMLDEIAADVTRTTAAEFPADECNARLKPYETVAVALLELVWQGTAGHRHFQRSWERPSSWERARIPAPPDGEPDETADLIAARIDAAVEEGAQHDAI